MFAEHRLVEPALVGLFSRWLKRAEQGWAAFEGMKPMSWPQEATGHRQMPSDARSLPARVESAWCFSMCLHADNCRNQVTMTWLETYSTIVPGAAQYHATTK